MQSLTAEVSLFHGRITCEQISIGMLYERICCSFYQYLPMIKSHPTAFAKLTTSSLPAMSYVVT